MHTFRLLAAVLLPLIAAAQTNKQTFPLIYSTTDQDANEIFTAVRTIADTKGTLDSPRQFTVEGTPDQLRTAEWVLHQLDQPADAPRAGANTLRNIEDRYQEDTARVFYLPRALNPQEFNEVQTAVRTITDIRRVYPHVSRRAIVLRATEEAVNAAEWLIAELTGNPSQAELVFPKNQRKGEDDNHTRLFRLAPEMDVHRFNETQTMVRALTNTRRVYPYAAKRILAVRGSEEQLALSRWVLAQLANAAPVKEATASAGFTTQSGDLVRLFYFPQEMTTQSFNDAVVRFRATTGLRQVFSLGRVLGARGTPSQIAELSTLVKP